MKEETIREYTRGVTFESGEKIKLTIQLSNIEKYPQTKDFLETIFKEIQKEIMNG